MNSSTSQAFCPFKSSQPSSSFDMLNPFRQWISHVQVGSPRIAHRIARLIPAQCPFERDIVVFGRQVAHIPPLCKLNPLYDELVELRFKALCYLADECGEDISAYI
ncbi:Mo-dependent nitrogenase C-terminal domain-containing protein [Pseudanabaena sp. FACHB-2040]|nr:Mo-dependent nitrogenase C-terminal domain-containing protein [Pseudanabaena sp. FACHB-2040]MBD2256459.1 Mo-dependent nitrogenase C-terminal domain-containing protein [Pseudanabaena sp. FACHB-2040]